MVALIPSLSTAITSIACGRNRNQFKPCDLTQLIGSESGTAWTVHLAHESDESKIFNNQGKINFWYEEVVVILSLLSAVME